MRMHDYLTDGGLDFSATDQAFAALVDGIAWLEPDQAYLTRLALHELLVNVRTHAYGGGPGAIEIGATATEEALTVTTTDWGAELPDVQPQPLPHHSEEGGYGLAIIDKAFTEVAYRRVMGRNRWVLTLWASREPSR
ncbi:MAG: ATP-binding protein [Actinobacteria bacterium]|nr:ATP-binding protein [Actinomycetota bacterium]